MSDRITLIGTIATEPLVFGAGTPTQFCTFRLASNERRYSRERNEWTDGPTNWFTVNAFRGLGEHAKASLDKGDRIVVHGRLRIRRWEKNEKSGTSAEVDAEALGHDLRWGVSSFSKQEKNIDAESVSAHSQPPVDAETPSEDRSVEADGAATSPANDDASPPF